MKVPHVCFEFLNLYRFKVRQGLFCLRRIRAGLVKLGFEGLLPDVDRALEVYTAGLELEMLFRSTNRNARHGRNAVVVDGELGRALGAFDEGLALAAKVHGEESPEGRMATGLREALLPQGVGKVTFLAFAEKEAHVSFMLEQLESKPELGQAVQALGLGESVQRLEEVVVRYRKVVRVKRLVTFAEVREARGACQGQLIRITALLLARRLAVDLPAEEAEALDQALDEVLGQQVAIRRQRRRSGSPEAEDELDELDFDEDESDEGPPEAEETEPGGDAAPPIAQPIDPPAAADHDGAGAGAA